MTPQDMTLGDFVQQLLVQLGGDAELHFKDERPWHELFYKLKTDPDAPGKPTFFETLFFDWNGAYPKCLELSEYLHALHWTGCMAAANPGYDLFKLNPEVEALWHGEVSVELQQFMLVAADIARPRLTVV